MAEERLQKILARAGIASRRKAEELIEKGRVRVDGQIVTQLGVKADPRSSKIELDGKRLVAEPLVYGVLHKPRGMVSTLSDPEGRPTVRDLLGRVGARVVPIGRLDFHTSGTLLFTNDGEFAAKLAHPSTGAPKVYVAKVKGSIDEKSLPRWTESIDVDGRGTRPADVRVIRDEGEKTWIQVTLREGRNRQVRRLGDHAGTPVQRLARISQAGITSEGLKPGEWRFLSVDELMSLKKLYGVPKRVRSAATSGLPKPTTPKGGIKDPRRAVDAKTTRRADAERRATPARGERADARSGSSAYLRAERSASRAERSVAPRGERSASPRAERAAYGRGERTTSPRGERSAAPRGERAAYGRSERTASPRAERSASPRGERAASPRGQQRTGARTSRGTGAEQRCSRGQDGAPRQRRGRG